MSETIIRLPFRHQDEISSVGFLHQMSVRETYPRHTHEYFELSYVLKGKAIHHINGRQTILSQGTLVFIRPDDVHSYSFINNFDMELLSMGIKPELVDSACAYLGLRTEDFIASELPPQITYEGSQYWHTTERLMQIGREEPGIARKRYFQSLFPDLLNQFERAHPADDTLLPPWLSHLVEAMSKPENFVEGLPKMLELSKVSQGHLTRSIKRYLGLTPTAFINLKRINYSAELLLKGDPNILDICYQSGFNHIGYFYQVFESTYHCTPRQFINTHRSS